jgi:hypothetical protein
MAFSYKMVDMDLQQMFESLDNARRSAYEAMVSAGRYDERSAENHLRDLKGRLNYATNQLADLQRKISILQAEAAKQTPSGSSSS